MVKIENVATIYGTIYSNEDTVGDAIALYLSKPGAPPRSSLYITTKIRGLSPGETVEDSLRGSLRKLRLDYVDMYLIHFPTAFEGRLAEVWKGMEEVQKLGLAKSIGVSNWRGKRLYTIFCFWILVNVVYVQ